MSSTVEAQVTCAPMSAGALLRALEDMKRDRPDEFETMPVYFSALAEGDVAKEEAQIAAGADELYSTVEFQGTVYRAELHHAPSIDRWFVLIEGEDDDRMGDQSDEDQE